MSRVFISSDILKWAIKRSGKDEESLKKPFPKISDWISGSVKPTLKQIEKFSKATSTPLGFLFLHEPPAINLSIPHFRTVSDSDPIQPSTELIDTVYYMEQRQDWLSEFLESSGRLPLNFVGSCINESCFKKIATHIRSTLNIEKNWATECSFSNDAFDNLRKLMEDAGVVVVANGVVKNNTKRKLDTKEFRGFVLIDEYAPLVFINSTDAKAAQVFTLAHELAHIFLGKSAAFDLLDMQPSDDPVEKLCNQVAAEFLVPEELIKKEWATVKNSNKPFKHLAKTFKVSEIVVARRALDLKYITKQKFFKFYNDYIKNIKESGGGDFYAKQNNRIGGLFSQTIVSAVKSGQILYSEAYQLTGLRGKTFDNFIEKYDLKKVSCDFIRAWHGY